MFPTPSPLDIMMDLAGHTVPFLTGEGHAGLVWGARGVIAVAVPVLVEKMEENKDYQVIIAGYSLGGGIAQLLSLELQLGPSHNLLPPNSSITTLAYGSPPVFTSRHSIPVIDSLVLIQNSDDLMSGVSLRTITDLLDRIRAIERLNIRRRILLKMAVTSGGKDGFLTKLMFDKNEEETAWKKVENAILNIPEGFSPYLHHLGKHFLVLERNKDKAQLRISQFTGFNGSSQFSSSLHLHPTMVHDHMPWSYNQMFAGFGFPKLVEWEDVANLMKIDKVGNIGANNSNKSTIYWYVMWASIVSIAGGWR
eukprot:GFUD01016077.1.p1 GENE.GFUD01016077.1~~GFUD01016077.1.p1  ORF type:complete len:308 (+),score=92.29 GFUD01016077.1:162-1085(+)